MPAKVTIDSAGRVLIPKALRKKWHLQPGDTLEMEAAEDEIKLRLARAKVPLTKERGVWVFRTDEPLPARVTEEVLETIRAERDEAILGGD